ncbi:hypothetical protein ACWWJF_02330 [Symbiopectobacterium sp. Eva_TO]
MTRRTNSCAIAFFNASFPYTALRKHFVTGYEKKTIASPEVFILQRSTTQPLLSYGTGTPSIL